VHDPKLLAQGLCAKNIGAQEGLSVKTVEDRRGRLLKKLHRDSIAERVQYAIAERLIPDIVPRRRQLLGLFRL